MSTKSNHGRGRRRRRVFLGTASAPVSRLLEAHEIVLQEAHAFAHDAVDNQDDGANDLLVSNVIRTNELEAWFVSEYVVEVPLAQA